MSKQVRQQRRTSVVVGLLRDVLATKYLYTDGYFASRTEALPNELFDVGTSEAFFFKTRGGRPFILAVATNNKKNDYETAGKFALGTETIGILVISDSTGESIEVYRRRFDSPKFERIPDLEYYFRGAEGARSTLLGGLTEYQSIADEFELLPISHKLENLFFEIHSCMRDIDGLHADAAIEELCKLLYVKSYIEEQATTNSEGVIQSREFGCTEEYAASIRGLYREAIDYDIRVFRLKIPQYERSRGVFQEQFRLSSAALVKAFQLIENYSLSKSKADIKGRAFQKVIGRAVRSGMGQYFTPKEVCDFMVAVMKPRVHHLILDPFCGSGHFLTQSLAVVATETDTHSKEFHEFAFGKLHGIEKSDRMTRIAMTDMRLRGDGHSNIRCVDALLAFENYPDIAPNSFDIVLTNPPFGSLLGAEALSQLGKFELARDRKKIPLEILGLERVVSFLRPGGRLGIVLPDSIFSVNSTLYVREWLKSKVKVRGIISLPIETFCPFGANVKTSILFARKWQSGESINDSYQVCLIKISSVGYDAAGRPKNHSDLDAAVRELENFLSEQGW